MPRYRQKVKRVPFNLTHPVWIDDPNFDLGYHVRHEVLTAPGDGRQLREAVARIFARPMDMRRPLWEMTIVSGINGGRVAVLNRAHHAMVDGVSSADIATLLLDLSPEGMTVEPPAQPWQPRPAPSSWYLVRKALVNLERDREGAHRRLGRAPSALRQPWGQILRLGFSGLRPKGGGKVFFNRRIGIQRTGRGLRVPLQDLKALKTRFNCTVNDAVLGVIAEGLHRWFLSRGTVPPEQLRVFCPVSVRDESQKNQMGNRISGMVVDLPTGELEIDLRLARIQTNTAELKRKHQALAADRLAGLADWAPPTLLVLAGRVMSNPQGGANINVTNVPGPQFPLYTGGAEMLQVWPFAPLYPAMGLGIAIVSYNGGLYFGFTADPEVVPDIEEFTRHIKEASEAAAKLVA